MKKESLQKKSLTKLLRSFDIEQRYFITTDQITGQRFAVAQFGKNEAINIKSNFMTFKEIECFLFGVSAVKNGTIKF